MALTPRELRAAITYNTAQDFSDEDIRMIQRITGSTVDGLWGEQTCQAVADFQQRLGIHADGRILHSPKGNTWPKIVAAAGIDLDEREAESSSVSVSPSDPEVAAPEHDPRPRRKPKYRSDDINLLLPAFHVEVAALLAALTASDHNPVLFDTLRTPEEAARNAARGRGSRDSIHLTGAAADIICGDHGWSCEAAGCDFYRVLGTHALQIGLTWGGSWTQRDLPHVQGISVAEQAEFRAITDAATRDAFVVASLKRKRSALVS